MCSPYPEFVLTNIICIEKALKGIEIMFVLARLYIFVVLNIWFVLKTPEDTRCPP